jgi:hypothetical protein
MLVTRELYIFKTVGGHCTCIVLKDYIIDAIYKRDRAFIGSICHKDKPWIKRKSVPSDLSSYWWRADDDLNQQVDPLTM